jgi:hypothetical protein
VGRLGSGHRPLRRRPDLSLVRRPPGRRCSYSRIFRYIVAGHAERLGGLQLPLVMSWPEAAISREPRGEWRICTAVAPEWSSAYEDTAISAQPRPAASAQRQRSPTANPQVSDPQK